MESRRKGKSIGSRIMGSMTHEQIASLLDVLLGLLDDEKRRSLLSAVTEEIADALSQILYPKKRPSNQALTDSKYQENWEGIWSRWHDCTFELGDEDGRYVFQEHHWEAPEFDGYALSEDLEKVSEELLPLLDRVYSLHIEADEFLEEELNEIEYGIVGYPEWMGAEHAECILGPNTTACFLRWEWLAASSKKQPATEFLKRIRAVKDSLKIIDLDRDEFIEFFMSLPNSVQKQLYEHIRANKDNPDWKERLRSSYSEWHRVYHSLSASFDAEEYLADCLKHLPEDWEYGLPLIENLLESNDYAQAEELIEQTFSSFLRLKQDKKWLPEDILLVDNSPYHSQEQKGNIIKLLRQWMLTAGKVGNQERVAMLSLQLVTFRTPYQWDPIVECYRKLTCSAHKQNAEKLMSQWKDFVAKESMVSHLDLRDVSRNTWIHWLIETETEEKRDACWFSENIRNWLALLSENPRQLKAQQNLIQTLTEDLAYIAPIKTRLQRLLAVVGRDPYLNKECSSSRRKWLKNMEVERVSAMLVAFWKDNILAFVPNPSDAYSSQYSEHAEWVLAVEELNPTACSEIIRKWKIDHKRRRNLWKALRQAGFSV